MILIRFIFRCLAVLSLAIAVIFAIIDGARSVGASQFVATPFLTLWAAEFPEAFADAKAFAAHYIHINAWDTVFVPVLTLPAWLIFAVLAFLFYAIGRRRSRKLGRFSAR